MPWFRIDDGFHSHPKRMAASLAAVGLWTVAGSWSSAHLTDGVVPDHVLPMLHPDAPQLAGELVAAGLWKRRKGGYQFHDWSQRNPSRTAVETERKKNAERQRKWREKQETAGQEAECNGVTNDATNSATNDASNAAPTRPDPKDKTKTPARPSGSLPPEGTKRATRIPEDFTVTESMAAWAREHVPRLIDAGRGKYETDKFIDHWHQASGATARKRDWTAAWRNWMRRADDDMGRQQQWSRPNGHQPAPDEYDALINNWARPLDSQEAGNDPRGNGGPRPVHRGHLSPAEN